MNSYLERLAMEPPFRLLAKEFLKRMKVSLATRDRWELSKRPAYLTSIVEAAKQGIAQGHKDISVIEFGVSGGNGLVVMQEEAQAVEKELGIGIKVYGFDMGNVGLPPLLADYRDHPDAWKPGDFKMDEEKLKARLTNKTTLILGNVRQTVETFFEKYNPPAIGFVSFDLDLYSSTKDALKIFTSKGSKMLWNTPVYFDDIEFIFNHKFAGEFLAIDEFNQENENIKIDRWYGVEMSRPFPERYYFKKLYVAHDLSAISKADLKRSTVGLKLNN